MYTKCPECNIAFRVTATVLQQASGNVRCGGCNHAFNALHYLSEEMPETGGGMAHGAGDRLDETSRRLLETLDELAGPDEVRIEDTGVEWRVLDKNDADPEDFATDDSGEMRYDDSTLLPDDFGLDGDDEYSPAESTRRTTDDAPLAAAESKESQGELLLIDPEDWNDLLDEVQDEDSDIESLEVDLELAAIHSQLSTREGSHAETAEPGSRTEAVGFHLSLAEDALTDEVPLLDDSVIDSLVHSGDGTVAHEDEPEDPGHDDITMPDDEDTALSGDFVVDEVAGPDDDDVDSVAEALDDDDYINVASDDDDRTEPDDDDRTEPDDDESAAEALDDEADDEMRPERESTGEFESQIDEAVRALRNEEVDDQLAEAENEVEGSTSLALEDEATQDGDSAEIKHFVPPLTEEEMTVNMEIDQEMMAMATQDDEFSATLFGVENPEDLFKQNADTVETIVMEGEFIHGSIERERLAAETAAKAEFEEPGSLVDTYAMRRGKVRGGRRRHDPVSYGFTIGVVVLALALIGQIIHNSRESLATIGFFNGTIAPVYRMLGNPVTPSWDIKGWQFETTTGNVDDDETVLTVVSRIVNRSDQPLPYPLVHISLTDRWEDVMGSRILEPGEYLAGDLDPSSPVLPGENFTAVITIENPSAEATGFKLNVCYRVSPGNVRCAIEDFKD